MKLVLIVLLSVNVALNGAAQGASQKMKTTEADTNTNATELATFGGGCFWCVEAVFERLDGVRSVTSGYAGGRTENPTYKQVCSETTGHAEVVQVEYDPGKISYEQLVEVFWDAHDPTTPNRQGADAGTQYRSIILYRDEAQRQAAERSRQAVAKRFKNRVMTEIVPLTKFYPAEEGHQDYFRKNPNAPYCAMVIRPKLQKLFKDQAPKP
jgi:peptide-methionine (S)-S-oxide reductase